VVHETVVMEGHLIDSDVLRKAFNRIVEEGGEFEVREFRVGKTNDEPSRATISVTASGVSAEKVVATIAVPAIHHGIERAERK